MDLSRLSLPEVKKGIGAREKWAFVKFEWGAYQKKLFYIRKMDLKWAFIIIKPTIHQKLKESCTSNRALNREERWNLQKKERGTFRN